MSPDLRELLEIVENRGRADIQAIEQFGEPRNVFRQARDGTEAQRTVRLTRYTASPFAEG